jgi:hypothetical protein
MKKYNIAMMKYKLFIIKYLCLISKTLGKGRMLPDGHPEIRQRRGQKWRGSDLLSKTRIEGVGNLVFSLFSHW